MPSFSHKITRAVKSPATLGRNLSLMLLADAAMIFAAHYLAYSIRFEVVVPTAYAGQCLPCLVWMIPLKLMSLWIFGLYRGMWRYAGLHDLINLLKANVLASTAFVLVILGVYRFEGFSRSVFIIDFVLSTAFLGGYRLAIRMFYASADRQSWNWFNDLHHKKDEIIIAISTLSAAAMRRIVNFCDSAHPPALFLDKSDFSENSGLIPERPLRPEKK